MQEFPSIILRAPWYVDVPLPDGWIGIPILRKPVIHEIDGRSFIRSWRWTGPGDYGINDQKVFANPASHGSLPEFIRIQSRLMKYFFRHQSTAYGSRNVSWSWKECWFNMQTSLKTEDIDYFVFGHRHLPISYDLGWKVQNNQSRRLAQVQLLRILGWNRQNLRYTKPRWKDSSDGILPLRLRLGHLTT